MRNPVSWFKDLPTERQFAILLGVVVIAYALGVRP
jgi:hypothetical protein